MLHIGDIRLGKLSEAEKEWWIEYISRHPVLSLKKTDMQRYHRSVPDVPDEIQDYFYVSVPVAKIDDTISLHFFTQHEFQFIDLSFPNEVCLFTYQNGTLVSNQSQEGCTTRPLFCDDSMYELVPILDYQDCICRSHFLDFPCLACEDLHINFFKQLVRDYDA